MYVFPQFSALKEQDGLTVQQLRDKLASLQGVLAAQSAAETRWRGERAALMAQLDTLNDHLVRTQQKVENVEADNRKIQLVSHFNTPTCSISFSYDIFCAMRTCRTQMA